MRRRIDLNTPSESIKTASLANFGSKVVNVLMQLVITMVLARLLTPEQYGTVAVLTAFSGIFAILADAGISAAIAQAQDLDESEYNRLLFLSLIIGIVLTLGFCLLSVGIAWFYGNVIYVPLGCFMSLAVLFNALNMVPNGVLLKQRKFKLMAARLVVSTFVVGIIAILLAYLGFGAFAIVANSVLSSLFILIWNLAGAHLRMSVGELHGVLAKVGSFSAYSLGASLIGWFANNLDSLIVGKLFGSAELGYYNKAFNIYAYPLNVLAAPITDTILPFLAPIREDKEALRSRFIGVFRKVSFISAMCTAGMHVCAAEVILIMYGDNWAPAIPMLSVLAFAVYSRGINGTFGALFNACGRADLLMRSTGINTAVTVSMICLGGVLGSVQTLAICVAIAYNIEIFAPIFLCSHYCLGISVPKFFVHLLPDIAEALAVTALAALVPWNIQNVFLSLVLKGGLVVGAMAGFKAVTDWAFYHERFSIRLFIR